ncbi:MAG: hypothetical protein ACI35O_09650 [Bacillaceae bacterium]
MKQVKMNVFLNRLEAMLNDVESVNNQLLKEIDNERNRNEDNLIKKVEKVEKTIEYVESRLHVKKIS